MTALEVINNCQKRARLPQSSSSFSDPHGQSLLELLNDVLLNTMRDHCDWISRRYFFDLSIVEGTYAYTLDPGTDGGEQVYARRITRIRIPDLVDWTIEKVSTRDFLKVWIATNGDPLIYHIKGKTAPEEGHFEIEMWPIPSIDRTAEVEIQRDITRVTEDNVAAYVIPYSSQAVEALLYARLLAELGRDPTEAYQAAERALETAKRGDMLFATEVEC